MNMVSKRLADLKTSNNLTQRQIAGNAGIPLRTYQRYETGEREPSASTLISLADFFNVSLDYLVGRSDNPQRL
ncbi:MAG: helix-turn-helix transcriptional regulator [Selenomonadaceae bacterium]|nr:helix-turn-helix transcriptional regulator [Selenomonadaceae bacterium]